MTQTLSKQNYYKKILKRPKFWLKIPNLSLFGEKKTEDEQQLFLSAAVVKGVCFCY